MLVKTIGQHWIEGYSKVERKSSADDRKRQGGSRRATTFASETRLKGEHSTRRQLAAADRLDIFENGTIFFAFLFVIVFGQFHAKPTNIRGCLTLFLS